MNKYNSQNIIMTKYEKYLSPFGRDVLSVLLEHYSIDERNQFDKSYHINGHEHFRPHQSERSSKNSTSNILHSIPNNEREFPNSPNVNTNDGFFNTDNEVEFTDINGVLLEINSQTLPKSVELVKSAQEVIDHLSNQDNTPFDISQEISISNTVASAYRLFNAIDNEHVTLKAENRKKINHAEHVAWDNMFDSELLPKTNNVENRMIDEIGKRSNVVKTFEITFPEKAQKNNDNKKFTKTSGKQSKKHKTQSLIADKIPKKVKKVDIVNKMLNPNFRKQKFTKTVKNWLNDVDPTNLVNDIDIQNDIVIGNDQNKINRVDITFENTLGENKRKRTVQAQLSNENGVMKFCKPKNKEELGNKLVNYDSAVMETKKERKIRSKFVAPIKSQIPVKDVTYKVVSLENESFNLEEFKCCDEEVVMTIIYSNGYCQLNDHHTEDSGLPQGIMFHIGDNFYHLKGASAKYKEILQILDNKSVICFEGKNILTYLYHQVGWSFNRVNFKILDAKIGGSLLDPDSAPNNFSELQKLLAHAPQYTIASECVLQQSAWHMTLLKDCWRRLRQSLDDQELWHIFVEIEMRVLPIIAGMEYRGVSVDIEKLNSMEELLQGRMKAVERDCYKAAGKTFQINSAVQLRSLMNIHPLPKLILEYRHLHKAKATFLTGTAQCVRGGVVRPLWEQTAAATGRIACNTPNLQAVPKTPFSLSLFPRAGAGEDEQLNLRSVYARRAGRSLLAADFKQAECRVLALAAADGGLLRALRSPDLFRVLAAGWLNKPEAEVTTEERERTKRVVYASMYGAGANKLADVLGLGYEHALSVTASFNRTFPSLKRFARAVVAQCEREGKLRTPCGRARHFKDIGSSDVAVKAQAERKALNFIIQGSAADLCKMAMVETEQRLRRSVPPIDGHLLLQIHDELVWEVKDEDLDRAAAIIKSTMEGCGYACGMPVVLPVAVSCGHNWGEMKQFTPKL